MIIVEGIDYITVPVPDLQLASKFYSDIFDSEILEEKENESIVMGLEFINIKLLRVEEMSSALSEKKIPMISFSMDVDDFTEAIAELESKEIEIIRGPESNENGEFLHFLDPGKNIIEILYKN